VRCGSPWSRARSLGWSVREVLRAARMGLVMCKASPSSGLSCPPMIGRQFRSNTSPRIAPPGERQREARASHMGDCVCSARPSQWRGRPRPTGSPPRACGTARAMRRPLVQSRCSRAQTLWLFRAGTRGRLHDRHGSRRSRLTTARPRVLLLEACYGRPAGCPSLLSSRFAAAMRIWSSVAGRCSSASWSIGAPSVLVAARAAASAISA
jgi:hypothetical protein